MARVARYTLAYYALCTAAAVALGVLLVNLIQPGRGRPLAGSAFSSCRSAGLPVRAGSAFLSASISASMHACWCLTVMHADHCLSPPNTMRWVTLDHSKLGGGAAPLQETGTLLVHIRVVACVCGQAKEEDLPLNGSPLQALLGIARQALPDNVVAAAVDMNILGVITFSLFFGVCLASLGEQADALIRLVNVRGMGIIFVRANQTTMV